MGYTPGSRDTGAKNGSGDRMSECDSARESGVPEACSPDAMAPGAIRRWVNVDLNDFSGYAVLVTK